MASKTAFKKTHNNLYEKQKFRNVYILLLILSVEVSCLYFTSLKLIAHKPFIIATFSYWPLVIFTLLVPTMCLLAYYVVTLETIYNDDGIFYRWTPYTKRFSMIQWDAIREITLIDLRDAGGYWKFSKNYDRVHYLGGKTGLYILMRSGKKRLIGTSKAEALNRILVRLAGKSYLPSQIPEDIDYSDD